MFPINSRHSQQLILPLSQIGAAWSSFRSMLPARRKVSTKVQKESNLNDLEKLETEDITKHFTEHVKTDLKEIGLENLVKHIKIEAIFKKDAKSFESLNLAKNLNDTKEIFGQENRTHLLEDVLSNRPVEAFKLTLPNFINRKHNFSSFLQQQIRTFKYRPNPRGMGKISADTDSSMAFLNQLKDSLREKVMKKSSESSGQDSQNLKKIISSFEKQPQVQEQLKVAFAEGYSANQSGKGQQAETSTVSRWFFKFFWYGLLIWIVFQILQGFTVIGGNMKGLNVLKGERYEVNPEEINVTFDDVMGVDEAKEELQDVVEFLRDPERFKKLGAKLPKGVLLVGPPGIGKTLLARAVAGEASVPFFHASGSEFDEIFVGTGAKRVRQLFDAAKARSPCVIFIDEIDTVGAKRTSSQIHPYANQTINQLLSEMDGFQQTVGVIVLGATNRRDNLDKALLRPGRFDVEVRVFPPDLKGRRDIIEHYLKRITIDSSIDIDKLARGTTGCTGADLENMVNQAALKAAMDSAVAVSMEHLEYAKDKVLMGPAKKTRIPDEETNKMTAYHEAGHTIVAFYTKNATPLHKVTIVPRGMSLGHTSFVPEKEEYNQSKAQLLAQMDVAMGGRVAEELIYGSENVTTGASSDFLVATNLAKSMVKKFGMSDKVGVRVFDDSEFDSGLTTLKVNDVSPATTELVDSEIRRLLYESYDRAKTILRQHHKEHKELAKALLKYETLDFEDIKLIMEGKGKKIAAIQRERNSNTVISNPSSTSKLNLI
ncbi:DgyrCDS4926 [Dimorphilus gyrociliatus]|uniref:DgyrCDS4926 n=1 Tax=Dimorphilus gyrociliatus TaxID=2664684 RepID=A0A7I8VIX3_9ANNE|nr:DgyrCDS4926 [Dimorphilus gyrociliatus]